MPRFESHIDFLRLLVKSSSVQRNALLKSSTLEQRLALIELILNFLKGSFLVEDNVKQQFYKYRNIFRKLSRKSAKHEVKLFVKNSRILKVFLEIVLQKLA